MMIPHFCLQNIGLNGKQVLKPHSDITLITKLWYDNYTVLAFSPFYLNIGMPPEEVY